MDIFSSVYIRTHLFRIASSTCHRNDAQLRHNNTN